MSPLNFLKFYIYSFHQIREIFIQYFLESFFFFLLFSSKYYNNKYFKHFYIGSEVSEPVLVFFSLFLPCSLYWTICIHLFQCIDHFLSNLHFVVKTNQWNYIYIYFSWALSILVICIVSNSVLILHTINSLQKYFSSY